MDETIKAAVVDITDDGLSVAKSNGAVYFFSGAVLGDLVSLRVLRKKNNYFFSELVSILSRSADFVESDCPYFRQCGGCALRELNYDAQVRLKAHQVKEKLKRAMRCPDFEVGTVLPAVSPNGYRNNVQLKASVHNAEVAFGFFASATHTLIPITQCLLLPDAINKVLNPLASFCSAMIKHGVTCFQTMSDAVLRLDSAGGIAAVIKVKNFSSAQTRLLQKQLHEFMSRYKIVSFYLEDAAGKIELIGGEKFLNMRIGYLNLQLSINSFFQVNSYMYEKLFNAVRQDLECSYNDIVFDLFCGVGSIGLSVAKAVKRVVGVEVFPAAVENARINAAKNSIDNAEFFAGAVESVVTDDFVQKHCGSGGQLKIVVDPPRAGIDKKALQVIAQSGAKGIVAVSCNPGTLARDVQRLCNAGYKVAHTTVVDMFPYTPHVETVVRLQK